MTLSKLPTIPSMGLPLSGIDRETWLELRRSGIGGSESAAVMGESPWGGPYEVWLRKTGRDDGLGLGPDDDNPYVEWGNRLEASVLQAFEEKSGIRCQPTAICRHASMPFMMATPDAFAMSDDGRFRAGIVEIKTANAFVSHKWGKMSSPANPGEPIYPLNYEIQCRHNMAVCDLDRAYLAVLIGGNDFRWYKIKRDPFKEAYMIKTLGQFWQDFVEGDDMPCVDNSDACRKYIDNCALDFGDDRVILPQSEKVDAIMDALKVQLDDMDDGKRRSEESKNELRDLMRSHSGAVTAYGTVTYRSDKNGKMRLTLPRGWRDKS